MEAGKLNKRVTIQQAAADSPPVDVYGQPSLTWTAFATVWAAVEPIRGRDFWAQQQGQSEITYKVRIRYLAGIMPSMRVVYGSKYLYISHIINVDERNREIELMCNEGVRND